MMNSEVTGFNRNVPKGHWSAQTERFLSLVDKGVVTVEKLQAAENSAVARGIELERVLLIDCNLPRRTLLEALSDYYHLPFVEYDERMPIPPDLLSGLDSERLSLSQWFPLIRNGDTVVIAVNDPLDREALDEIRQYITAGNYEFRVALGEDIQWFIQDFLHSRPGHLIGTERTGLAFWRNTMAQWRTRLACYRTDLARARTELALLRWGFGFIALSDTLMHTHKLQHLFYLYWAIMAAGFAMALYGVTGYLKIRKARMKPPGHHTLVEVTAATLQFLEKYHFIEGAGKNTETKGTMLARLGDFLAGYSTILYPSPASRERTHLARERNVLAAQRTVAACYRTIYARARTGLAFIRSGISFLGLGLGLMHFFGFSLLTVFDALLVFAGLLMATDGALWYLPVRKEQAEVPRCEVSSRRV